MDTNNKYLVISYDDDQQQTFFDHVSAANEADAKGLIGSDEVRGMYAQTVAAIELSELRQMADWLEAKDAPTTMYQVALAIGDDDAKVCQALAREQLLKLLEKAEISVSGTGKDEDQPDEALQAAVWQQIKDNTVGVEDLDA